MRHVHWLLVLLLVAALLLAGCTEKDREQTTQSPAQSANAQIDPSANNPPDTQGGGAPAEPAPTVPVPTELETQDSVVIDVTGQPVIGG